VTFGAYWADAGLGLRKQSSGLVRASNEAFFLVCMGGHWLRTTTTERESQIYTG